MVACKMLVSVLCEARGFVVEGRLHGFEGKGAVLNGGRERGVYTVSESRGYRGWKVVEAGCGRLGECSEVGLCTRVNML